MYETIEGDLTEINPAFCVIETGNIGYIVQISLNTYSKIQSLTRVKLFIHQVIREDAHLFYGFSDKLEREMFRALITVSGIGANTARMMLSSLTTLDLQQAIAAGNTSVLQSIKGIGTKTAQRVIIELRDKLGKEKTSDELFALIDNRLKDEALSALVILGFNKTEVDKVLVRILAKEKSLSLEDLIKKALKQL
ncbi:MAG: Holliday junction branch migration protein RuvA [Bacteroidales bacterium]|nr:Holliday junction branch migration protein RuvA [Bacteroidales bacterium]